MSHLLVGCSFTDPLWQDAIPWSVYYHNTYQKSYIVAKAGMGINGICTEAYTYAQDLNIKHCVIMLPDIWRMDIELNHLGPVCNAMVDLLEGDQIIIKAHRKWLISGGLHYDKTLTGTKFKVVDFLYKHKSFLPLLRDNLLKLKLLLCYLKTRNISYTITTIRDPMEQLIGLDHIKNDAVKLLNSVDYDNWLKFDQKFINAFLGHNKHPTTEEHEIIGDYIWKNQVM